MALTQTMRDLEQYKQVPGKNVLSLYLNTDRSDSDQQKGEWLIRLKNGLKRIEEYIQLRGEDDQLKKYKKVKRKVKNEIERSRTQFQKGVVIFANETGDLFHLQIMQLPVETEFFWDEAPNLQQLKQIQTNYPSSGVVIANDDHITLVHKALGELETIETYDFDLDSEDWRNYEGLAASEKTSSGATHRDKFDDRKFENQIRWARDLIPTINRKAKSYGWKYVDIVGQTQFIDTLKHEVNVSVNRIIRKTISSERQYSQMIN